MKSIQRADEEALDEFSCFNSDEVHECLVFLDKLFTPYWASSDVALKRCLIVALALHGRVKAIQKDGESSDEGFRNLAKNGTAKRAKSMVATVCCALGDAGKLKAAILSMDLLERMVAESIGSVSSNVDSLAAASLKERILRL